ncbi:MAG: carboxypeptidase-like regulatory domain-containing protein [Bacteroidota bacterium]
MTNRMHPGILQRYILLVCLLAAVVQLSAQEVLSEKKVSISARNKQVQQLLEEMSLQTGYFFTYNTSLIPSREKVSFHVENLSLNKALDSLLNDPSLGYRVIDRNIVLYRKNEVIRTNIPADSLPPVIYLTGSVSDLRSGKALPYATVALVGSPLGTISNLTGDFTLKIPSEIVDPILVFSFIGYKNVYLPVSLPPGERIKVSMERDIISLQEVIIRYQDPVILLHEAVRRISQNYIGQPSQMTGFYREAVQRNSKYMLFSEAVLDIAKCPYAPFAGADRTRIFKGRKIINVSIEDTVLIKISSGISTSLQLDIVKNLPDFLSGSFEERYYFEFSDIVTFGNKLAYEISFRQKENIQETLYTGKIYLDQYSLAIVAADFELDPLRIGREQNMFVLKKSRSVHIRPISATYHVEYRESDGKYYFGQARGEVRFKLRKKREWISSNYSILIELAITNMIPGRNPQFKAGEVVRPRTILSEEEFEYDPGFWGDYNTIVPEVSLQEALRLIGKQLRELQEDDSGEYLPSEE